MCEPSHVPVESNIHHSTERNSALVAGIEEQLAQILEKALSFDGILQAVCDVFAIELNAWKYSLAGPTIWSFLSYLSDEVCIEYQFVESLMM